MKETDRVLRSGVCHRWLSSQEYACSSSLRDEKDGRLPRNVSAHINSQTDIVVW